MNAPPWPINPDIGQWFNGWAWTGTQWIAAPTTGLRVLVQPFTASGSYMPSPGLVSLTVECVGGGGAGGAAVGNQNSTAVAGWIMGGGGGGSGGYSRSTLPATLVRGGVQVTVGAGGVGNISTVPGANGGDTLFGALVVAKGGIGATPGLAGVGYGIGGRGGPAGIGQVVSPGNGGGAGIADYWDPGVSGGVALGGAGGGGYFGGTGINIPVPTGGSANGQSAAPNTGAGGDGGASGLATLPASGGDGGSGVCIVTEYCWGDVDQPQPRPPAIDVNLRPWPPGWPWPQPPWPPGPRPRGGYDPYSGPGDYAPREDD